MQLGNVVVCSDLYGRYRIAIAKTGKQGKLKMNIPQTISRISTADSYLVVDSSVGVEL